MRYALYLILLFASLPLAFLWPFYGLCAYFVVSFMQPKMLCWAPQLQDSMMLGLPLVAGAFLLGVSRRALEPVFDAATGRVVGTRAVWVRNCLIEPSVLTGLMALLLAYIGLTRVVARFPLENSHDAFMRLCKVVLVTLLMTGLVPDARRLRILYAVTALSVAFWAVKGGLWTLLLGPHQVYGADYDNNLFALRSAMALPLLYGFGQTLQRSRWRSCFLVLTALTGLGIVGSGSRAGFLALAAVLGCLAWSSGHRLKAAAAVLVMTAALAAVSWQQISDRVDSVINYQHDRSASARRNIWSTGWQIFAAQPLTGTGFGNFETAFREITPWSRAGHNIFLQNLVELGVIGHALWLAMLLGALGLSWRLSLRARRGPPSLRWMSHLARGIALGLLAFLLHGAFHNEEYLDLMFTLVGFTIACNAVYARGCAELRLRRAAAAALDAEASSPPRTGRRGLVQRPARPGVESRPAALPGLVMTGRCL